MVFHIVLTVDKCEGVGAQVSLAEDDLTGVSGKYDSVDVTGDRRADLVWNVVGNINRTFIDRAN